jgi:hypothetical protein
LMVGRGVGNRGKDVGRGKNGDLGAHGVQSSTNAG